MKTTITPVPTMDIEKFAEREGLHMKITERENPYFPEERYCARFEHADVWRRSFWVSPDGQGATPEEAIASYVPLISQQTLVIDACGDKRREIRVPRLTYNARPHDTLPDVTEQERFTVAEIREWLDGWHLVTGDGEPAGALSLESILAQLECDQDGIAAWRDRSDAVQGAGEPE